MTTMENDVEEGSNGFGYGQLEHGHLVIDDKKGCFGGCWRSFKLRASYLGLGKQEIWLKTKEASRKYGNEYRISICILLIIILICFFVLLGLILKVNSNKQQNNQAVQYSCRYYHCAWSNYVKGKDWGYYSTNNGNCLTCQKRCTDDATCTGIECGDGYCSWWKGTSCTTDKERTSYSSRGLSTCMKTSVVDQFSDNCTIAKPCGVGHGTCTSHKQCKADLECGNKNCSLIDGKSVDDGTKCCFKPESNVTSSSVHNNDIENYGPDNIIREFSLFKHYFKSKKDDFPWIQWKLPRPVNMTGLTLFSALCSRKTTCPVLRNIEVRAGKSSIANNFSGKITVNQICGEFKGPGEVGGEYSITCKNTILADFISVQLLDDDSVLGINNIKIEKERNGLLCTGSSSCCIPGIPCYVGEGDCNVDHDCQEGLICGHNNCPKQSGKDWDMADDCCYEPKRVKGSASASSIYQDQNRKYGPRFAIDGLWTTRSSNIYRSKIEKLPWIQWHMPNRTRVFGIALSTEYGTSKFKNGTHSSELLNIEVRSGPYPITKDIHGKITSNNLCGRIEVRGGEDRAYTIVCDKSILSDYITVQMLDDNAVLKINELELMENPKGSKIDCSCHDFVNRNGYGGCNKTSSYEHIKNQAVCYVNQPSNCSDLAYSSTNPGKKFSSEACKNGKIDTYLYSGKYDCKKQGCWTKPPYVRNHEYGIYSGSDTNCTLCQDKCSKDNTCGSVECGGDETQSFCIWWKKGECVDKNSQEFFKYNTDQHKKYGFTCYKKETDQEKKGGTTGK